MATTHTSNFGIDPNRVTVADRGGFVRYNVLHVDRMEWAAQKILYTHGVGKQRQDPVTLKAWCEVAMDQEAAHMGRVSKGSLWVALKMLECTI